MALKLRVKDVCANPDALTIRVPQLLFFEVRRFSFRDPNVSMWLCIAFISCGGGFNLRERVSRHLIHIYAP